jgi:hypothetical protein
MRIESTVTPSITTSSAVDASTVPRITSTCSTGTPDRVPIDIPELYKDFPELDARDRTKIENFESVNWLSVCPREGLEKIKLKESTVVRVVCTYI